MARPPPHPYRVCLKTKGLANLLNCCLASRVRVCVFLQITLAPVPSSTNKAQ